MAGTAAASTYDLTNGINFSTTTAFTTTNLNNLFTLDVDGSGTPVTMDLSYLKSINSVNSVETMRPYLYANTDAVSGRMRSLDEPLQGPVNGDPRWLGT